MKNNQPNPKNSTCVGEHAHFWEEREKVKITSSHFLFSKGSLQNDTFFTLCFIKGTILSKLKTKFAKDETKDMLASWLSFSPHKPGGSLWAFRAHKNKVGYNIIIIIWV